MLVVRLLPHVCCCCCCWGGSGGPSLAPLLLVHRSFQQAPKILRGGGDRAPVLVVRLLPHATGEKFCFRFVLIHGKFYLLDV